MLTMLERLKLNFELSRLIEAWNIETDEAKKLTLTNKILDLREQLGLSSAIQITGKELGNFNTETPEGVSALREATKDFLFQLRGKKVYCKALNEEVEIRKRGIKKTIAFGADPRKLKALAAIEEIIKTARKTGEQKNHKQDKKPRVTGYYYLEKTLILNTERIKVKIIIERDDDGNLFYEMQLPKNQIVLDSIMQFRVDYEDNTEDNSGGQQPIKNCIETNCIHDNIFLQGVIEDSAVSHSLAALQILNQSNQDELKKLIPDIEAGLNAVNNKRQESSLTGSQLLLDGIKQLISGDDGLNQLNQTSMTLVCDGVELAVSELQRNLDILENNFVINLQENNLAQADLEKRYIGSIKEAIYLLGEWKGTVFDSAEEKYVLNLFI